MKGILAFLKGFSRRNVHPATFAWLANVAVSLVLFFACYRLLSRFAGDSLLGQEPARYGVYTLISEIVIHAGSGFWLLLELGLFLVILFVPVSLFVSAGVFGVLVAGERGSLQDLVVAGIKNFWKFVALFLLTLLVWLPAALISLLVGLGLEKIQELFPRLPLGTPLLLFWMALTMLLIFFAAALSDLAKIACLHGGNNAFVSLRDSLRFVLVNRATLLLIFLLYTVPLVFLYLAYWLLLVSGDRVLALPLPLLLALFQVGIFIRYYLKVALVRAEIALAIPPLPAL